MHMNGLFNSLLNIKEDKIYMASSAPETWLRLQVSGLRHRMVFDTVALN